MISRSFCWAIMKKMTKKWDLETSNAEIELKIGIYAKNWARQVRLKFFDYGQSQRSTVKVNGWRVLMWQCDVTLRLTWQYMRRSRCVERVWCMWAHGTSACGAWVRERDTDDAWSACSQGRNFRRRVWACVRYFLAVLGWVLLGIGCSVALCLCFHNWMSRMMISESCRDYGRAGGDSLLSVTTGWRWGQGKNAGDVHRNQKVRGMALIPC